MTSLERDSQASSKLAMREVASTWLERPLEVPAKGSYLAYDALSKEFLERVNARLGDGTAIDQPRQYIETFAAVGGVHVVGRYFFAGAFHAAQRGFTQKQLVKSLYAGNSYTSLQQLTREWNDSATEIEYSVGLNGQVFDNDSRIRDNFILDEDHGFTLKQYALLSYRARSKMVDRGKLESEEAFARLAHEDTIRCPAASTGVLPHVYKHMLTIATSDPALFKATLEAPAEEVA